MERNCLHGCSWDCWRTQADDNPQGAVTVRATSMRDCFFQRRWPDGWSHKESGIEVGIYQHLVDQDGLGGIGDLFRPRGATSHRCERERQQPGFEDERQLQAVDRTVIAERSRLVFLSIEPSRGLFDLGLQEGLCLNPEMQGLTILHSQFEFVGFVTLDFFGSFQLNAGALGGIIDERSVELALQRSQVQMNPSTRRRIDATRYQALQTNRGCGFGFTFLLRR